MIDYFTLALTHGLMAVALWRLLARPDLDEDGAAEKPRRRSRATPLSAGEEGGDA
ncbi:hypothetical protein AEB_P0335 [Altererythrobacter sp. B11]|uniref:hypothetical protein n=1 Tax=Altererythrobacter sp. B11 TaxID=2060312 RepID=UPI000DC6F2CA|nr:hypothetical protein [Altererythrobacter sp. B11]BBC71203.1 hypothetical protein AEB_P0335 [Altererythrobacter sp. B11]